MSCWHDLVRGLLRMRLAEFRSPLRGRSGSCGKILPCCVALVDGSINNHFNPEYHLVGRKTSIRLGDKQ